MLVSKTQRIIPFVFLLAFLFLSGCKKNEKASFETSEMMAAPAMQNKEKDKQIDLERKLIKEGTVRFETTNLDSTRKQIARAIKKYDGYVSSDQSSKSGGKKSNEMTIRVPAKDFDVLLNQATEGVDKFDYKNINVKDVTNEFLDVRARLKTKKALEKRYLKLLEKAETVKEMLSVENEIGKLQADIESVEGRLNYLKNRISYSTLTLDFYVKTHVETEFSGKFANSFKNGWNNMVWFFVVLVNLWPFIVIILIIVFIAKYLRKRKKKQRRIDDNG